MIKSWRGLVRAATHGAGGLSTFEGTRTLLERLPGSAFRAGFARVVGPDSFLVPCGKGGVG
jgi:hypothetical protein